MFTSTSIDLRSTVEKLLAETPRSAVEAVLPLLEETTSEERPSTIVVEETPASNEAEPTPPAAETAEAVPTPYPTAEIALEPATDVVPATPFETASEIASPTAIEIALDAALDTTREIRPEARPDLELSEPTTIVWIPPPPMEQGERGAGETPPDAPSP